MLKMINDLKDDKVVSERLEEGMLRFVSIFSKDIAETRDSSMKLIQQESVFKNSLINRRDADVYEAVAFFYNFSILAYGVNYYQDVIKSLEESSRLIKSVISEFYWKVKVNEFYVVEKLLKERLKTFVTNYTTSDYNLIEALFKEANIKSCIDYALTKYMCQLNHIKAMSFIDKRGSIVDSLVSEELNYIKELTKDCKDVNIAVCLVLALVFRIKQIDYLQNKKVISLTLNNKDYNIKRIMKYCEIDDAINLKRATLDYIGESPFIGLLLLRHFDLKQREYANKLKLFEELDTLTNYMLSVVKEEWLNKNPRTFKDRLEKVVQAELIEMSEDYVEYL